MVELERFFFSFFSPFSFHGQVKFNIKAPTNRVEHGTEVDGPFELTTDDQRQQEDSKGKAL